MPCNAGGRSAAGLFESRRRRRSSHGASGRRRVRSVTVSGLRLRGNPALATALPGGIARAIVVSHYTSPLKGKQNKWYNLVTSRASESMLLEKGFGSHGLARGPVPSPSSGEKKNTPPGPKRRVLPARPYGPCVRVMGARTAHRPGPPPKRPARVPVHQLLGLRQCEEERRESSFKRCLKARRLGNSLSSSVSQTPSALRQCGEVVRESSFEQCWSVLFSDSEEPARPRRWPQPFPGGGPIPVTARTGMGFKLSAVSAARPLRVPT